MAQSSSDLGRREIVFLMLSREMGGAEAQSRAGDRRAGQNGPRGGERRRQRPVKSASVPEIRLGAAEAAVPGLDREGDSAIPFQGGAGIVSDWPFAADLVKAPTLPGAVVIETVRKQAPLVKGPPIAADGIGEGRAGAPATHPCAVVCTKAPAPDCVKKHRPIAPCARAPSPVRTAPEIWCVVQGRGRLCARGIAIRLGRRFQRPFRRRPCIGIFPPRRPPIPSVKRRYSGCSGLAVLWYTQ